MDLTLIFYYRTFDRTSNKQFVKTSAYEKVGVNFRDTGDGTAIEFPVGCSLPVLRSMRNVTMESDRWFAASKNVPEGSIAKFLGVLPSVETCPIGSSLPAVWSILKAAMLSCPRFEP